MARSRLVQMQRDFNYDGVYLDEIAYDRVTIMRTKAVLGDTKLIDHHCDIGEIAPSTVFSVYTNVIPFCDHNPYPHNAFGCQQGDMGGNSVSAGPGAFSGLAYRPVCSYRFASTDVGVLLLLVCRKLHGDVCIHRYAMVWGGIQL